MHGTQKKLLKKILKLAAFERDLEKIVVFFSEVQQFLRPLRDLENLVQYPKKLLSFLINACVDIEKIVCFKLTLKLATIVRK